MEASVGEQEVGGTGPASASRFREMQLFMDEKELPVTKVEITI